MEKVGIFVDVQNIYYTTRDTFKRPFNYRHFYADIANKNNLIVAYAYAIDKGDAQQQKFQSALKHIGFDVKLKPFIQRADGSAKGDWDVGITIDIMEYAHTLDRAVLLSGDGDFAPLLNKIRSKYNCASTVYGVLDLSANALINSADEFIDIDDKWLL
ncbi:NYN domain-containing protein [Glaciecola siphonariae]|uniref:NYN domain-containing protein n=1 Tax=Glaciecola siphonariae TaxID=521012 RepID=A0ABV9LZW0_9ALTE